MANQVYLLNTTQNELDLFEEVDASISALAFALDDQFFEVGSEQKSDSLFLHTWTQQIEQPASISFVVDTEIPARWLSINASSEETIEKIVKALSAALPIYTLDQLRNEASTSPTDLSALQRFALGLNRTFDQPAFNLFASALQDSKKAHRIAGSMCAVLVKWPQLVKPIDQALSTEQDAEVKRVLEHARKVCSGNR